MRRFCALTVCVAMVVGFMPVPVAAAVRARQQQVQTQGGTVQGVARDAQQQPIRSANVQLRNVQTGQIAATGTTDSAGDFAFTNIPAGSYIVEVVDSRGAIIATTAPFTVTAGSVASVTVTASAAGAAGAAAAAAAGGGGLFGMGTTGTVLLVAGAAAAVGITVGVVKHKKDKSPKS